jgi:hypothetical protein
MLDFPQPGMAKSKTAETATNSKVTHRGNPNRINPIYNHVRL